MPLYQSSTAEPAEAKRRVAAAAAEAHGRDRVQTEGVANHLLASLSGYGFATLFFCVAVPLGLAEWQQVLGWTAYNVAGLVGLYLVLKAHGSDPVLPQVLLKISSVAVAYILLDVARSVALQWLCLIIVLDIRRLRSGQLMLAAALAVLLPVAGLVFRWCLDAKSVKLADELVYVLLSAMTVPILIAIFKADRALSWRQRKQSTRMAQTLEQLSELSIRDGLTGLYNRRHMQQLLDQEQLRCARSGLGFSVGMLDIDLFKRVNDSFGHGVGDLVLRKFAYIAQDFFKESPHSVGRWGGEEFLFIMPETSEPEACMLLDSLRVSVAEFAWEQYRPGLKVTCSGGVSRHAPTAAIQSTLFAADAALYRAKVGGRDRIEPGTTLQPRPFELHGAKSTATQGVEVDPSMATAIRTLPHYGPNAQPTEVESQRFSAWLSRLIKGRTERMRNRVSMCLVAVPAYVAWLAMDLLYAIPNGVLTPAAGWAFAGAIVVQAVLPYTLIRSGVSAKFPRPALVLPQILGANCMALVAYVLIPDIRSPALQVLCLSLMFGFVGLRPSEARIAGRVAIGILATALILMGVFGAPAFEFRKQFLQVSMTIFILWLITDKSLGFGVIREQLRSERVQLARATDEVRYRMSRDVLTGLFNRQHMQQVLQAECLRHDQSGRGFSVALIDLDHFKRINDSHGHEVGDEALIGFAQAAQRVLRETDVICRWGGEEFLVLLPESDQDSGGFAAIERLREHVLSQCYSKRVEVLRLSFSAGLASRLSGESLTDFLERADQNLYLAKAQGRNRCVGLAQ